MAITDLFTKNRSWKLASLFIAMVIWASVHPFVGQKKPEPGFTRRRGRSITLPITVMTSAADSRGFRVRPSSVDVTVRGAEEDLARLTNSDLQAFVSLVDVREARDLRKRIIVHTPPGIDVLWVEPEDVRVDRTRP